MPTSPTAVDALPTAPSTSSPSTFDALADAFVAALATLRTQINALGTNVYNNAVEADVDAAAALSYKNSATIGSSFKGNYSAQTGAAAVPYSVYHLNKYWTLLSNLADVTAKVPGTDAEWAQIPTALTWVAKTANYTAAAGDGVLADTSGGAWTLTLPASPVLGDEIAVVDAAGTFQTSNLTLARNSLKIMGLTEDMTVSTQNASFVLVYSDSTNGWRIR